MISGIAASMLDAVVPVVSPFTFQTTFMLGSSMMVFVSRTMNVLSTPSGNAGASIIDVNVRLWLLTQASRSARAGAAKRLVPKISTMAPPASSTCLPCAAKTRAALLQPGHKVSELCTIAYLAPPRRTMSIV